MIRLLDEQLANMVYIPSVPKPAKYSPYPPQTADSANKQVIILKNPQAVRAHTLSQYISPAKKRTQCNANKPTRSKDPPKPVPISVRSAILDPDMAIGVRYIDANPNMLNAPKPTPLPRQKTKCLCIKKQITSVDP